MAKRRRPQDEESVAATVFHSTELLQCIFRFQFGIYEAMFPFRRFRNVDARNFSLDPVEYVRLNRVLTPWYARYKLSQLDVVVQTMPYMRILVFLHAIFTGQVSILKLLHRRIQAIHIVDVAKYTGRDPRPIEVYWTTILDLAASRGHLEVVRFLHSRGFRGCSNQAMNHAAKNGHLEVVKFLHDNRQEGCTRLAMDLAASNGHLDVVQWLHANRSEGCSSWALNFAARHGHLEIVKFLVCHRTEGLIEWAISHANGHPAIVKYLEAKIKEPSSSKATE
ncbi:hypothetical protein LEN26_019064 [Aphanomyces euteiches]|nr:hypothetical protein LEN26_019064 [Aphanomyces euteiches]KAH9117288.1 hypothetical protein AeMF1_008922 [Aphanomyces euteiches]KAH9189440.1 hypothetical protein AeNC1_008582 [Aphanomyces euteiches]